MKYLEAPTRTEFIDIGFDLDYDSAKKHKKAADFVLGYNQPINPGDTLKVTYHFKAEYFGECEQKLDAVARILADDKVVITNASIQELRYGHSVLVSLVQHLTRIIDRAEAGSGPPKRKSPWRRLTGR